MSDIIGFFNIKLSENNFPLSIVRDGQDRYLIDCDFLCCTHYVSAFSVDVLFFAVPFEIKVDVKGGWSSAMPTLIVDANMLVKS